MTTIEKKIQKYPDLKTALRNTSLHQYSIWEGEAPSDELTLFVHGYARKPWDYRGLLAALREGTRSDVYAHRFDLNPFCTHDPETLTAELAETIRCLAGHYQRLHLCGHSLGCLFIRAALIDALKQECDPTNAPLSAKIESGAVRMTQLAGTNRGYQPSDSLQSAMIGFVHRWFWFALMSILWGAWCRYWPEKYGVAGDYLSRGAVVFWSVWGIACLLRLWQQKIRDIRLSLLTLLPVVWSAWGASYKLIHLAWPPLFVHGLPVLVTGLTVLGMGFRLGMGIERETPRTFPWKWTCFLAIVAGLLAGLVGGMKPDPAWLWPATLILALLTLLYPMSTGLLVEHALYGSAWITGVRLSWLKLFEGRHAPPTVHLFGEEDSLVAEDDHLELAQRGELLQIALRGVKHSHFELTPRRTWFGLGRERVDDLRQYPLPKRAVEMVADRHWREKLPTVVSEQYRETTTGATEAVTAGKQQSPTTETAFNTDGMTFLRSNVHPDPVETSATMFTEEARSSGQTQLTAPKKHVVFLVHGIRDYGEWQDSLANEIRKVAGTRNLLEVVAVRYGYFSAFQFLFSGERERATRSFLDLYTQTKVRHPNATCHVAAHSNGTYVVGVAMLRNKFVELENLYLAGSVLQPEFAWPKIRNHSQLTGHIRSDRANRDWPVGVLCFLIHALNYRLLPFKLGDFTPWRYLGSGGVDGFQHRKINSDEFLTETAFLSGDHGAALHSRYHEEIARFLFDGMPRVAGERTNESMSCVWRFGVIAGVVAGLALVVLLFAVTASITPVPPLWPVLVSALLTMVVIRVAMSI